MNRCTRALVAAGLALASAAIAPAADAADEAEIALGMTIYKTTGDCASCHAWTGRGALLYEPGEGFLDPPPSLLRSTMDRATMIELLACGTPGGKMPQHLAEAWSDRRPCYGKILAELPANRRPPRAYTVLTLRQIEALASFVIEVYRGQGMSLANCIKYHGPPARLCDLLR